MIAIGFAAVAQAQETAAYQYDALGRLISSRISGGPSNGIAGATSFDSAGNRTSYAVAGVSAAGGHRNSIGQTATGEARGRARGSSIRD